MKALAHRVARFFGYGGTVAWVLIGTALLLTALSTLLFFGAFWWSKTIWTSWKR